MCIAARSREDETRNFSSKRKSKSSMVKVHVSFQMSRSKRDLGWPSGIAFCIPMSISSLVFSGTGCPFICNSLSCNPRRLGFDNVWCRPAAIRHTCACVGVGVCLSSACGIAVHWNLIQGAVAAHWGMPQDAVKYACEYTCTSPVLPPTSPTFGSTHVYSYGVATTRRLLKMIRSLLQNIVCFIDLFCKRDLPF